MIIVIAGASQGLGLALCQTYLSMSKSNIIYGTYRKNITDEMLKLSSTYPNQIKWVEHNIEIEESYEKLKTLITQDGHLEIHRFINCIGALQIEGLIAERKIEEVNLENMKKSFLVNSIPTLLFAKYFKELFKHKNYAVFAAISAKVASLEDNNLGGWYSYRSSKTALNMIIKNLSLEFRRLGSEKYVITVHPGTTKTRLSEPFMAAASKKYKIHTPEESAKNLINVFENLKPENNGQFLNYDHSILPW